MKSYNPQIKNFLSLILLVWVFIILPSSTLGQQIRVIDTETGHPVSNVAVYTISGKSSTLTGESGNADLTTFPTNEKIYFQHPAYINAIYTVRQLDSMDFLLELEKQYIQIEEFVVSAYRWEQNTNKIPNKIHALQQPEIEYENPQTTADLLRTTNEVFIQKSQMGGGSPMIRGFASSSVLLVVDGVRMNNAIYRSGNLHNVISLDPNSIETSEVIFGPGSVTYGSDALGGVMDFHSLKPRLSTSGEMQVNGQLTGRYSSANKERMAHAHVNIGSGRWAFLSSISFTQFDDLIMGSHQHSDYTRPEYVTRINARDTVLANPDKNVQVPSGYDQLNFMQRIRFNPDKPMEFIYTFHHSKTSDIPRYDRLIQYSDGTLKYADWYYGPQRWNMHSLKTTIDKSNLIADRTDLNLSYQFYEESRNDRRFQRDFLRNRTESLHIFSTNLNFEKTIAEKSNLYYGLDWNYNNLASTAYEENIRTGEKTTTATRYPDGKNRYQTMAAYLSYHLQLNDKTNLVSGLRYTWVDLLSELKSDEFYDFPFDEIKLKTGALNGSLGLAYRPAKTWQMNLNLSSGFHAPNIDDIAKVFDSEPGSVVVPNSKLKPEYAYNLDAGIKKTFKEKLKINATAFYTLVNNAMVRRDFTFNGQDSILYDGEMSKVNALVNADQARIYGFHFSLNWNITKSWFFESYYNYTKGYDQDDVPIRHVAPAFGLLGLSYHKNDIRASFDIRYNGEISNNDLAPSEQSKTHMYATDSNGNPYSPSWYTLNLKMRYRINNELALNAGLDNILDVRYRPYSSGIVAPGRNIYLALRVKF